METIVRQAAARFNIKLQALAGYVRRQRENSEVKASMQPNYTHRQIFSNKEELNVAEYLQTCSRMDHGLTTDGALPEAMGLATSSGWMNSELFEKVLERFITQQKYERQPQFTNLPQPRELHFHQRSKKSTRKAAVQILTLPPHGSNLLQPLD
ncbi:hypothetical protein ILUMI_16786, partial [Ignelater luminosus]